MDDEQIINREDFDDLESYLRTCWEAGVEPPAHILKACVGRDTYEAKRAVGMWGDGSDRD